MIMDESLEFCSGLSVAATAGTANRGDVIDLVAGGRRIESGVLHLVILVSTTFDSAGSATVQFKLVSDSVDTPATDGSETVHWASDAIGYASLTAGQLILVPLPAGIPAYERYLGLQVVTASATTTAGAISAMLVNDAHNWAALADASN